ncbi:uncharacterized protein PV09_07367 [Verruconis gallopava]|uniref:Uncharacterized protein n=1 Tax=Verruconis gallopava TaxID=253628 RepID=A0A0D1XFW5_9PEZI|nr:uncharacterized protein PV09_07367 [Verruconis gallopava]KIW01076.1 hypothetical protein PV09_07367 [Verruconis gallopava]
MSFETVQSEVGFGAGIAHGGSLRDTTTGIFCVHQGHGAFWRISVTPNVPPMESIDRAGLRHGRPGSTRVVGRRSKAGPTAPKQRVSTKYWEDKYQGRIHPVPLQASRTAAQAWLVACERANAINGPVPKRQGGGESTAGTGCLVRLEPSTSEANSCRSIGLGWPGCIGQIAGTGIEVPAPPLHCCFCERTRMRAGGTLQVCKQKNRLLMWNCMAEQGRTLGLPNTSADSQHARLPKRAPAVAWGSRDNLKHFKF